MTEKCPQSEYYVATWKRYLHTFSLFRIDFNFGSNVFIWGIRRMDPLNLRLAINLYKIKDSFFVLVLDSDMHHAKSSLGSWRAIDFCLFLHNNWVSFASSANKTSRRQRRNTMGFALTSTEWQSSFALIYGGDQQRRTTLMHSLLTAWSLFIDKELREGGWGTGCFGLSKFWINSCSWRCPGARQTWRCPCIFVVLEAMYERRGWGTTWRAPGQLKIDSRDTWLI